MSRLRLTPALLYGLLLPLLLLSVGTVLFRVFPWDMEWADQMHSPEEGWNNDPIGLWKFLYNYGVIPAVITVVTAFIILMLGFGHPLRKYRKICLYIISCLAVGPGLITNALLKEFWGRPRPKQVVDFGGEFPYEPLLTIDLASSGKSFPCGHATMGFFFFCIGFAFLHKGRHWLLLGTLLSLTLGGLIGYARLVQGGHFPSDTLWAAAVCWFVTLGLYYAYGLHKSPLLTVSLTRARAPWVLPTMGGGVTAILLLVCLATPYDKTSRLRLPARNTETNQPITHIVLEDDSFTLQESTRTEIRVLSEGSGHRFPKSRHRLKSQIHGDTLYLTIQKKGFFTELITVNSLEYPAGIKVSTLHPDE